VGHVAYLFKGTDTSVNLDAGTTQIYDNCFWGTGIRVVVIPASVTSIGSGAFAESGLERAYFLGTTPPTLESYVFSNCIATLVVPATAYEEYSAFPVYNGCTWECGYTVTCDDGITATSFAPIVAEDETVTLGYTGEVPAGYSVVYTVKDAANQDVTVNNDNGVYSFTMPASNVTVSSALRSTHESVPVAYVDADGTLHDGDNAAQAVALDGSENTLAAGTYFVGLENVNFDQTVEPIGDVTLILKDGCTMNIGTSEQPVSGIGIDGGNNSLTITSQTLGGGTLNIYTSGHENITAGQLTVNGGNIFADNDNTATGAIDVHGDITVNGGTLEANAKNDAICAGSNFTVNGGKVDAYAIGDHIEAIYASGNININGGKVIAYAQGSESNAILAQYNLTISGGNVEATVNRDNAYGIYSAFGNITLGWTDYADRITASSYYGTVRVKTGQALATVADAETTAALVETTADGTIAAADLAALAGKTLSPCLALADNADNTTLVINYAGKEFAAVQLSGRTLYKDGKWNTLCLPFALSAEQIAAHADFSGATLMELDTDGKNGFDPTDGTLYLTFKAATAISAGVPYLVKWDAAGTDFTSPTFSGVTINATATTTVSDADGDLQDVQMVGCYSPVPVEANDKSILFLGDANTLYYSTIDRNIRSCRAYFSVPYIKGNAEAMARAFHLDFGNGEQTGITTTNYTNFTNDDDAWYSLDGRKLNGKPTKSGVYVNGGRKVVIK